MFSWLTSILAVAALPSLATGQQTGAWRGSATFADGGSEEWTLVLGGESEHPSEYILVDAGLGLLLRDVAFGPPMTFGVRSPNVPEGFACSLTPLENRLVGSCAAPDGEPLELSLSPIEREVVRSADRPRARQVGLDVGVLPPGPENAITDVAGVRVGQVTVDRGDDVRTGVTVVVPADGDLYARPVPGWIHTVNGYGKLIGETQVREFGEIETPIVLTCTLCVWSAARGLAWAMMERDFPGQHTINPVVGETNDSWVNDMWQDPIARSHVEAALAAASGGPVEEGSVGAGRGTGAFGWKGGIGTSSRALPTALGGYTVGVLVQTNFGGNLTMNGAPVGQELGSYLYRREVSGTSDGADEASDGGSLMIVVATDAPVLAPGLRRLAERAMLGAGRTGSFAHDSSGDYVVAFSAAPSVRKGRNDPFLEEGSALSNADMSPLFAAVVEATEEAIYNAILRATPVEGRGRVYMPIPLEATLEVLERYGALGRRGRGGR